MSDPLFVTSDIWLASVAVYLYGWESLASIEDIGSEKRTTTYSLSVPSEDAKILTDEYYADKLALSSAKAFVAAYHRIVGAQRAMRNHGETTWIPRTKWERGF